MTDAASSVACPCGGHSLTLAPGTPPVGGRGSFVCPACGRRRLVERTAEGVAIVEVESEAAAPTPSPVPPAVRVALAVASSADWTRALAEALPPGWHVLAPADAGQAVADFLAHAPGLVLTDDTDASRAVAVAAHALPGRDREGLVLLALAPAADGDAMAAFTQSADAVLDSRLSDDKTGRIRAALARAAALPSLFTGGRG